MVKKLVSISEFLNSKKYIALFIACCLLFAIICAGVFTGLIAAFGHYINKPSEYEISSGWDCDQATFETEYVEAYMKKIEEIEEKYSLNFGKKFTKSDDPANDTDYEIYLYDNINRCFVYFCFDIREKSCLFSAYIVLNLSQDHPLEESYIETTLNFINDFVNFAGYDTKTDKNNFEYLYKELIKNGSKQETNLYNAIKRSKTVGYNAYRYNHRESEVYRLSFIGLLKPLE